MGVRTALASARVRRLCFVLWLTWPWVGLVVCLPVHAQPALRALDAAWQTPRLLPPRDELVLAASAGYGLTERVADTGGLHHRAAGSLALGLSSRLGLAAELRLDGRYDVHRVRQRDDSLVGDPRLYLRYGLPAHARARVGVEVAVWAPGSRAPSLDLRATSVDLLLAGTLELDARLSFSAALGPRFDRSARTVDPAVLLSRSDQISLGVSSYDAWLMRAALSTVLSHYTLLLELSADTFLGKGAPRGLDAPVRTTLLLKRAFARQGQLEINGLFSTLLSGRAGLTPSQYVPFEPRFQASLGARWTFGRAPPAPLVARTPELARAVSEPSSTPVSFAVNVVVADAADQPLPDVALQLGERAQRTSGAGEARFEALAPGAYQLQVRGTGFVEQTLAIEGRGEADVTLRVTLQTAHEQSLLRLLVRDAESGAPVRAACALSEAREKRASHKLETASDGSAELSLPAGRYRVTVRAAGYRAQTRTLQVPEQGVTLFNIDLTPEPP